MIFFSGEGEFKPQLTTAWTEIHGDTKQRQAVGQSSSHTLMFWICKSLHPYRTKFCSNQSSLENSLFYKVINSWVDCVDCLSWEWQGAFNHV